MEHIPPSRVGCDARRHRTIALLAVVAALLFAISHAHAGEYKLLRYNDPIEGPYSDFVTGVCTAMEENLKKFKDRPYGMACYRELDPALGFTRPKWERLDILKHQELAMTIIRYKKWDMNLGPDPRPWPERLKEMVEKENLTMDIVRLDLDRDGKPDNLVRFGFNRPCDAKEIVENGRTSGSLRALYVMDQTLTRVEPYTGKGVDTSPLDDVFLFKGIVYADKFGTIPLSAHPHVRHDGTLGVIEFSKHGAARICTFHYFDSPAPKGGK